MSAKRVNVPTRSRKTQSTRKVVHKVKKPVFKKQMTSKNTPTSTQPPTPTHHPTPTTPEFDAEAFSSSRSNNEFESTQSKRLNQFLEEGECVDVNKGNYDNYSTEDGVIVSVPKEPNLLFGEDASNQRKAEYWQRECRLMQFIDLQQGKIRELELQLVSARNSIEMLKNTKTPR